MVTGPGEKPGLLIPSLVLFLPLYDQSLSPLGLSQGKGIGVSFMLLGTNSCPFCVCGFESKSEITERNESLSSVLLRKNCC